MNLVDSFLKEDYIICGEYSPDPQDREAQIINAKLCSYVIGMIMPGQRSLFMDAVMQVENPHLNAAKLKYRIGKKYDNPLLGVVKLIVEVYDDQKLLAVNHLLAYIRATFTSDTLPPHSGESLSDKVVLVIGGTKGIGAELVKKYAVQGATVIGTYYHDSERASALEQLLSGSTNKTKLIRCDVSDMSACMKLGAYLKSAYRTIDRVYLCAALAPHNLALYQETYPILEAYINQSMRLFYYPFFTVLDILNENAKINVFSSVALLDKQTNHRMVEYICAKSILENIVESVSYGTKRKDLQFCLIRAPKMLTEMNNTPTGRIEALEPKAVAEKIYSEIERSDAKTDSLIYLNL